MTVCLAFPCGLTVFWERLTFSDVGYVRGRCSVATAGSAPAFTGAGDRIGRGVVTRFTVLP